MPSAARAVNDIIENDRAWTATAAVELLALTANARSGAAVVVSAATSCDGCGAETVGPSWRCW